MGLSRTAIFSVFAGYFLDTLEIFGYFGDEANVIIWRYAVRRHLFSDLKMHDLDWLFRVKLCFRAGLAG